MMKKVFVLIFIAFIFCCCNSLNINHNSKSQGYRIVNIMIRQRCKEDFNSKVDSSYFQLYIPTTQMVYRNLHFEVQPSDEIKCEDGVNLGIIESVYGCKTDGVYYNMIEKYGKEYVDEITDTFVNITSREAFKVLMGASPDSSLPCYNPETIICEGIDSNGLHWKYVREEYISFYYEYVPSSQKEYYDFILSNWKFVSEKDIKSYIRLPIDYFDIEKYRIYKWK